MNAHFEKIGDFYECITEQVEHARAVAAVLDKTVSPTRTHGVVTVGVPYWQIDEARIKLEAAGYTVEVT